MEYMTDGKGNMDNETEKTKGISREHGKVIIEQQTMDNSFSRLRSLYSSLTQGDQLPVKKFLLRAFEWPVNIIGIAVVDL